MTTYESQEEILADISRDSNDGTRVTIVHTNLNWDNFPQESYNEVYQFCNTHRDKEWFLKSPDLVKDQRNPDCYIFSE